MNNVTRTLMLLDVEARCSRVEGRPTDSLMEPLYNTSSPQSAAASVPSLPGPNTGIPALHASSQTLGLQHHYLKIIL